MTTVKDSNEIKLKITDNINGFLFDYKHSKFVECDSKLAELNMKQLNGEYVQDKKRNKRITPCFKYLTKKLEEMKKHYWLSSGTLLGIWF